MCDNKTKVTIRDVVYKENIIWFFSDNFNSLFKMDVDTREVKLVGIFPNEKYKGTKLYSSIILINNKIYCIPLNAKSIGVYDIDDNKFSHILIDKAILECEKGGYYYSSVKVYKNYLFIFPFYCSYIIRLNLDNHNIDYISDWYMEIKSKIINENGGFFGRQVIEHNGNIYVAFRNSNAILELNCETLDSKIYRLGTEKDGYLGMCFDGDRFWMLSYSKNYIRAWEKDNNEISTIKLEKKIEDCTGIFYEKNVPFIEEVRNIKDGIEHIVTLNGIYQFVKEEKDLIFIYNDDTGILTIYDKRKGIKIQIELLIDYKDVDINRLLEEKGYILETSVINIKKLLENLKSGKQQIKSEINIGKRIYSIL